MMSIMFVVLLLMVGMSFFMKPIQPPPEQPPAEQAQDEAANAKTVATTVAHAIETRTIETDEYSLVMTNAGGGRASQFFLKTPDRYVDHGDFLRSQQPDDANFGGILPFEMTLKSFQVFNETTFAVTSSIDEHSNVSFHYATPDGSFAVDKKFSATDKPYVLHAEVTLTNNSGQNISDSLTTGLYIKQLEEEEPGMFKPGTFVAAKCFTDGKMKYLDATDKEESENYKKAISWTAVDESYFAIAIHPDKDNAKCQIENDGELIKSYLEIPIQIATGSSQTIAYDIYMGPKEAEYLSVFGYELPAIIDYGWIEVLAKPMAWILSVFHDWTGNWGLAIILLTLIVRLLLWPIAHKGQVGMMNMSKLGPLMKEIQEKYKDDQQMLAQKQMELYKQYNINPMAGCLPLLIQMPVFFALYRCIFVTGGLYNAPFYLWIKDLSSPDPYFILPVLSVALMLSQQFLMPSQVKTSQQRVMMLLMPIIFGAMMLFLPSGLCLYMIISAGIGMIQSFYVRRVMARSDLNPVTPEDAKTATVDVK